MAIVRTEAELVSAAQAGDSAALGQLLLLNRERLARFVAVRLPRSSRYLTAPEDVLQQAYATAFRSLDRFEYRGEGSFYAWLRLVVQRQMFNIVRDRQRQKRAGDVVFTDLGADETTAYRLYELISADGDPPSRAIRREEAIDALRVALAELPDDYREVIQRRYLQGQSLKETAEALGRTPAAVRSVIDRAKKRLQEMLGRLSIYLSAR